MFNNLSLWANLATILGLIVAVLNVLVQFATWWWPNPDPSSIRKRITSQRLRLFLGCLLAVFVFWLGTMVSTLGTMISTVTGSSATVLIALPFDGAEVSQEIDVVGVHINTAQNNPLWLYLYGHDEKDYYFFPVDRINQKSWRVSDITIGRPEDVGRAYKLGVISVDNDDNADLTGGPRQSTRLPTSAETFSEITVYRE